MKKKIVLGGLVLVVSLSGITVSASSLIDPEYIEASEEVGEIESVRVNGEEIDFEGAKGYYRNNSLMLPLRVIAEDALGFEVIWNDKERSVELLKDNRWTKVYIGKNSYFFARMAPFKLSQGPEIKDGTSFVPVEFFKEILKEDLVFEDGKLILKADKEPEEEILTGTIKEIDLEKKRILVEGPIEQEVINKVWLRKVEGSIIVDSKGQAISFEDIKVGAKVKAVLPNILNLSYPAQGTMVSLEVLENCKIEKIEKLYEEENVLVRYPKLNLMEDKEMERIINEKIVEFINETKGNELYQDLDLDYEVTAMDEEKISLLFTGSFTYWDEKKNLINSLNLDLETGEEINFKNYFKDDEVSKKKLEKILNQKSQVYGEEAFEAEGIRIYFRPGNVIVYYYPLDDSVENPIHLAIGEKELEDLVK